MGNYNGILGTNNWIWVIIIIVILTCCNNGLFGCD
jgi:hypothetical protein